MPDYNAIQNVDTYKDDRADHEAVDGNVGVAVMATTNPLIARIVY